MFLSNTKPSFPSALLFFHCSWLNAVTTLSKQRSYIKTIKQWLIIDHRGTHHNVMDYARKIIIKFIFIAIYPFPKNYQYILCIFYSEADRQRNESFECLSLKYKLYDSMIYEMPDFKYARMLLVIWEYAIWMSLLEIDAIRCIIFSRNLSVQNGTDYIIFSFIYIFQTNIHVWHGFIRSFFLAIKAGFPSTL